LFTLKLFVSQLADGHFPELSFKGFCLAGINSILILYIARSFKLQYEHGRPYRSGLPKITIYYTLEI